MEELRDAKCFLNTFPLPVNLTYKRIFTTTKNCDGRV